MLIVLLQLQKVVVLSHVPVFHYKRADHIANLIEQYWLTRYPLPQKLIIDRGAKFLAEFSDMMVKDYDVKK